MREDGGPSGEQGGGDFVEHIRAAEGDEIVGEEGSRGDGRGFFRRAEAGKCVGESEDLFGVEGIRFARRWWGIKSGICEAVVDGGEAGAAEIAEVGDLDGGGLSGEDADAVAGGVAGEIDEDVDAIFADEVGRAVVGEGRDVAPVIGVLLQARGDVVAAEDVGVAEAFDLLWVVIREKGFEEEADGVVVEIGGEVADAEGAVGGGVVGVREDCGEQGRGELFVPLLMLAEVGGGVARGIIEKREEKIAADAGVVWLECRGAAEVGDGFGDLAAVHQGVAEVVVRDGKIGAEGEGAAVAIDGFLLALGAVEGDAEVGPGVGEIRVDGECSAEGLLGFGVGEAFAEDVAEIVVGVGVIGFELDGAAEGFFGVGGAVGILESAAEVVVG